MMRETYDAHGLTRARPWNSEKKTPVRAYAQKMRVRRVGERMSEQGPDPWERPVGQTWAAAAAARICGAVGP